MDNEPPEVKRAESAGTIVMPSAGTHTITLPPPQEYREANAKRATARVAPVPVRAPYPTYGKEHDD
jgi:hypothetical protein